MVLAIAYDPTLVPDGGADVCCSYSIFKHESKEAAGHAFHHFALLQSGTLVEQYEEETDASDTDVHNSQSRSSLLDEQIPEGVSWKGSKKKKKKQDAGKLDYYKLLGLQNERWTATETQIKNAYRRTALEHHPDKALANAKDDAEKAKIEAHFLQVQEAFEVLSDPTKRREYDSVDDFDDSLPESCAAADFFRVFGPAFRRQSRWSVQQPVPDLGEDDAEDRAVDKFYKFWFAFKSWREFPHPEEEDVEQAEGREHRRWIERYNAKLREKAKKEDTRRLKAFVENAFNQDPRMVRRRDQERAAKEARKQAKDQERRAAAEAAEAKARAEAEAKAVAEAAAAASATEAKKAREVERKAMQKERKRLRLLVGDAEGGRLLGDFETEQLCERLTLAQLQALRTGLEAAAGSRHQQCELLWENQALIGVQADKEQQAKEAAKEAAAAEAVAAKKREAAERQQRLLSWSQDEIRMLEKALTKYPVGTAKRWEQIAAYVRTRTVQEIIDMAKHGLKSGKGTTQSGSYVISGKRNNTTINDTATQRHESFTDVEVNLQAPGTNGSTAPNGTASPAQPATPPQPDAAGIEWTEEQQLALVAAMKKFGKETEDRWNVISKEVPGKTKAQCFKRFKELRDSFRSKK